MRLGNTILTSVWLHRTTILQYGYAGQHTIIQSNVVELEPVSMDMAMQSNTLSRIYPDPLFSAELDVYMYCITSTRKA